MQSKPVGWFEIYVEDMKRAKAFYEAVFTMKLEKLDGPDSSIEMWSFPGPMDDGNGASGALEKRTGDRLTVTRSLFISSPRTVRPKPAGWRQMAAKS